MCRTLVAEEPHRPTILNLGHCPLKANVRCLIFPLQQGKMSSVLVSPVGGPHSAREVVGTAAMHNCMKTGVYNAQQRSERI